MLTLALARERTWHRTSFRVMGSVAELVIDAPASMIPVAVRRLRELESAWSRFDPASELERLHARSGRWTQISADLAAALRWALRMREETDGLFEPAVRDALEQWGYDRTFREIDTAALSLRAAPTTSVRRHADGPGFELDRDGNRAYIDPGTHIDLGGIGKGLAADRVAHELVRDGAAAAYVCLGGDIHAAGEAPEGGWPVPLVHPVSGEPFAIHALDEGGLVMSTSMLRRWQCAGGIDAHHLIDPRTGAPATSDVIAVAVASRSAARGEALAKAALIAGRSAGTELLRRAGVTAWLVMNDGITRIDEG